MICLTKNYRLSRFIMKTETRLSYSVEFKTKVVFELLLSGVSLQELSDKYQVSVQSINCWKKQMIESASTIFSTRKSSQKDEKEIRMLEKRREVLKKSINCIQQKNGYSPKDISQYTIFPTNRDLRIKNIYLPLIS